MSDQNLVDNIRKETYALQIYLAFNNNPTVIDITTNLISYIQDIYRYFEPSHFKGRLTVIQSLDDSEVLTSLSSVSFFDKNILINNHTGNLIFQIFKDGRFPLLYLNTTVDEVNLSKNALVYVYENAKEWYYANCIEIGIVHRFDCHSIYALQYYYLYNALYNYKEQKVRYSSCVTLKQAWSDGNRIFFKNGPEVRMQESLETYLNDSLRGVDVVREYNLGASKPVDIRVYWKGANRAALIEVKWLGVSKNLTGKLSAPYKDERANAGAKQIKEYLDLERVDTPTCITKGFLVLIDGRRII